MRKSKRTIGPFTIATSSLAAISLFSLLQRWLVFGMSQIMVDFVGYYREVANFLFGWIPVVLNLPFGAILTDLWTLSFVGVGLGSRVTKIMGEKFVMPDEFHLRHFEHQTQKIAAKSRSRPAVYAFALAMGLSGLATFWLVGSLLCLVMVPFYFMDDVFGTSFMPAPDHDVARLMLKQFLIIAVFLVTIFALNAYAPSAPTAG
jgi:hypothetical protein